MQLIKACRSGLIVAALTFVAVQAIAAPDPNVILKKAQDAVLSLNSYQATYIMSMDAGQNGSMAVSTTYKLKPKHNKMTMRMAPAGTPTGQMAMMAGMLNMMIIADGKNMYMFSPAAPAQGYRKGPIDKRMLNPASMAFQQAKVGTPKYLRTQNVNGKPAHVIEIVPNAKVMQGASGSMLLFFDTASNRFQKMTMNMSQGATPRPGAPQSMRMNILVKNEVVNAPIADSVFRFVPPPGAKEIKAGAGGMGPMGGMMGGGRPPK